MITYEPDDNAPLDEQIVVQVSAADKAFVERMKIVYGARSGAAIARMAFRIAFPDIARHAPAQRD